MFTQFFGNYLLNKQLVSPENLADALHKQSTTRMKLGVLAINAGVMTAEQVDLVHAEQQKVDKRIGDVMVDMGFATREQIEELFKTQPVGHLLLGQALVDNGYMTNSQFETALRSYKEENSISDADFTDIKDENIVRLIEKFYGVDSTPNSKYLTGYLSLLFKNLIRFIGDDFTPMEFAEKSLFECKNCLVQKISGADNSITVIDGDEYAITNFASRFAKEDITNYDEYAQAVVSEFLNLHNGLFTVNYSNVEGIELQLQPVACRLLLCRQSLLIDYAVGLRQLVADLTELSQQSPPLAD